MTIVDYLLLAFLVVVFPVAGTISYFRYVRRIERGEDPERVKQYQSTFLVEWSLFAVLVALWIWAGRDFALLGFTTPSGAGEIAGALLVAGLAVFLIFSRKKAERATESERADYRKALGTVRYFLPVNRRELKFFYGLSVTAGIVEEMVYRGYLFWLFAPLMPVWAVVIASAAVFALAHLYQGINGALQVFLVGLGFGGLYLLTGSIWIPILAHALMDILQGRVLYEYLRGADEDTPPGAAPAA